MKPLNSKIIKNAHVFFDLQNIGTKIWDQCYQRHFVDLVQQVFCLYATLGLAQQEWALEWPPVVKLGRACSPIVK